MSRRMEEGGKEGKEKRGKNVAGESLSDLVVTLHLPMPPTKNPLGGRKRRKKKEGGNSGISTRGSGQPPIAHPLSKEEEGREWRKVEPMVCSEQPAKSGSRAKKERRGKGKEEYNWKTIPPSLLKLFCPCGGERERGKIFRAVRQALKA